MSSFNLLVACVTIALVGCSAGTGEGLDPNGRPLSEGGGTGGQLTAEFKSIQDNIFTPVCTLCHSGAGAPQGLRLDSANSYALLVGVSSQEDPTKLRVQPGNPDASYLIQKLEGTAAVGARMPLGGPYLDQAEINFVRQWITDGAQPAQDPAPPTNAPATVSSMSPLPNSVVTTMPTGIVAIFSKDMTAASLTPTSFVVDGSGGDGTFIDGNEVNVAAASVELSTTNPRSATFRFASSALPADTYRVKLLGTGGAPVTDIEGKVLDGDNDGAAGGDYAMTFRFDQASLTATWRSIQDRIFTPICTACHIGTNAPQGLQLDEANSYDMLVNVASSEVPSLVRVKPFDAANSYLIQKLEGTAAVGERMPRGGTPLSQADIDVVRQWITAGASRDGTSTSDPTAPTVTLSNPGTTVSGTVTLSAAASDNVGVTEVRFLANGTVVGSDTTAPYAVSWNSTGVPNGQYDLVAEARDAAGNVGTSATVQVTVSNQASGDTTRPTVSIAAPAGPSSGTITLQATATDDVAVTEVRFYVDANLIGSDTQQPYSLPWDTTTVSNGSHTLTAEASDAAGNVGSAAAVTVTVDNADTTAPSVTLSAITSPAAGTVTLSATASDNIGVTQVRFLVDGSVIGTDTTSPYRFDWDTTAVADGSHSVTAQAADAAGNTTTSTARTVTVQNTSSAVQATWRSIQDNVFTPICTQCHIGAGAPEGLRLDEANSYDMLVNVRSEQNGNYFRVEPGAPDRSYLIQKVEGTASDGERMPRGLPPLPTATIDKMREWIANGAAR